MTSFTLKDIDDNLLEKIKEEAKKQDRSANKQIQFELKKIYK